VATRNEGDSSEDGPIARYFTVELEESTHPFFSGVWHGRHVLNDESPLLSSNARAIINKNGGYWPIEYNNALKIRDFLKFDELVSLFLFFMLRWLKPWHVLGWIKLVLAYYLKIVTLTGKSNLSALDVHVSKQYTISVSVWY